MMTSATNPIGERLARLPQPLRTVAWSVRREIWEHRFLIGAPLGVAALVVIVFVVGWPFGIGAAIAGDAAGHHSAMGTGLDFATFLGLVTGGVAAIFYCLEALHSERRDRSILFWKSLPVSDAETVLTKLAVPMLVIPVVVFVAVTVLCTLLLAIGSAFLAIEGQAVAVLWQIGGFPLRFSCLSYALLVSALWYAPIYCGLLLVSVWARHTPFLWVALPAILTAAADKLLLHDQAITGFYLYRLFGWFEEALHVDKAGLPVARDTARFFSSSGLWLGLAVAVVLFAAAVYRRRRASPF